MENNTLQHHGVKGMKWGVRKEKLAAAAGHTLARGISKKLPYVTNIEARDNARKAARQAAKQAKSESLAADREKSKERRAAGKGYVSVGEARYNARKAARQAARKASAESLAADRAKSKALKEKNMSDDAKEASRLKKKKLSAMSTAELKRLNQRMEEEQKYKRLNPNKVKKGIAVAGTVAAGLGTVALLYNNANNVIKIGKTVGGKIVDKAGSMVMSDLDKGLSDIYIK